MPGDTNGDPDVFVHDRQTGETPRVSVASDGAQANGGSFLPAVSADGRYVAFSSLASNLVAGDTNNDDDVFVVGAAPPAPVAQDGTATTLEDTPTTGSLVAVDPGNLPLTYAIVTNATLGIATLTDPATGAFSYTPQPHAHGTDSFTFQASNGTTTSNVATITVTISPVNDAPVAANTQIAVLAGSSAARTFVASDVDSSSLTYSIVSNGSNGLAVVTNASTGAFTYTATAGTSGADTFTFKANDGALDSNVATVSVAIAPASPEIVLRGFVTNRSTGQPIAGARIIV